MKMLLLLAAVALHGPARADTPIRLSLAPGETEEACVKLAVGDTLRWRFEADVAVAFNVHHHVGNDVVTPVDLKHTRAHAGTVVADRANDWCLMWTAPADRAARLTGQWSATVRP